MQDQPLLVNALVFAVAAAVIGFTGVRLTRRANALAEATGLGQAIVGAVLIGAITSLAGTVTSAVAAGTGHPELAVGNALGGIAAQTVFLAVADLAYRSANLEHAAASEANLTQGVVLILLLGIALLGRSVPEFSVLGIHPTTLVLFLVYGASLRVISRSHTMPMWTPKRTDATYEEKPAEQTRRKVPAREWGTFFGLVAIVATMGWVVARTGSAIAEQSALSESVVGVLFTAISTSLPELVVAVSAVRMGAVNLAMGDIIGGNTFDVLFLGLSDIAYRPGSVFHAVGPTYDRWISLCITMTAVLLLGLLRRQRHGLANIGFESVAILVLYLGSIALFFV